MKKITGVILLILTLTLTGCFKKKLTEGCYKSKAINVDDRAHEREVVICKEREYMMSEGCLNLGCRLSAETPVSMVVGKYKDRYGNLTYKLCEKIEGKVGIYEYQTAAPNSEWRTTILCANEKTNQFVEMKYLEDRWQGYLTGICNEKTQKADF